MSQRLLNRVCFHTLTQTFRTQTVNKDKHHLLHVSGWDMGQTNKNKSKYTLETFFLKMIPVVLGSSDHTVFLISLVFVR